MGNGRAYFRAGDTNNGEDCVVVLQEAHYYPFGLSITGLSQQHEQEPANKYQYNGKELNDEFGLNWNDYGTRWYDPAAARWWSVDPLAEKYYPFSGYNYVLGNPIIMIDPTGMAPHGTTGRTKAKTNGKMRRTARKMKRFERKLKRAGIKQIADGRLWSQLISKRFPNPYAGTDQNKPNVSESSVTGNPRNLPHTIPIKVPNEIKVAFNIDNVDGKGRLTNDHKILMEPRAVTAQVAQLANLMNDPQNSDVTITLTGTTSGDSNNSAQVSLDRAQVIADMLGSRLKNPQQIAKVQGSPPALGETRETVLIDYSRPLTTTPTFRAPENRRQIRLYLKYKIKHAK